MKPLMDGAPTAAMGADLLIECQYRLEAFCSLSPPGLTVRLRPVREGSVSQMSSNEGPLFQMLLNEIS